MEAVEAATQTVGSTATTSIGLNLLSSPARALKVLVRTPDAGVFLGNSGVAGAATGYELTPDREYEFIIRTTPGQATASANGLNVYNSGGSSATVSWLATVAE
jgi:hypothetical protein